MEEAMPRPHRLPAVEVALQISGRWEGHGIMKGVWQPASWSLPEEEVEPSMLPTCEEEV